MPKLIFGDLETIKRLKKVRDPIQKMVASFGYGPEGAACGACSHFIDSDYGSCGFYEQTHPIPGSGWLKSFNACGKFQRRD